MFDPLKPNPFPITSRYHNIETAKLETADRSIVYLKRRFVPPVDRFSLLQEHLVKQGDRLDQIAAKYLGDAEQFWRICDANGAIDPNELMQVGNRLRITLPEGIPGYPYA